MSVWCVDILACLSASSAGHADMCTSSSNHGCVDTVMLTPVTSHGCVATVMLY